VFRLSDIHSVVPAGPCWRRRPRVLPTTGVLTLLTIDGGRLAALRARLGELSHRRALWLIGMIVVALLLVADGAFYVYLGVFGQIQLVTDDLHAFLVDARYISLSFRDAPFSVSEFYRLSMASASRLAPEVRHELLGVPGYLIEHAGLDAPAEATAPFDIDIRTLHSVVTPPSLTHFFGGPWSLRCFLLSKVRGETPRLQPWDDADNWESPHASGAG